MKKIFFSLIIFLSLFFVTTGHGLAQESGIFGLTQSDIQLQRGVSVYQNERDGLLVWWYGSKDPFSAEFIYFKDDSVVMNSIRVEGVTLQSYLNEYGRPVSSIRKYKASVEDPLDTIVHVWPEKGVAVQTSGLLESSNVMRIYRFAPTSLDAFLSTLSPDLKGNENITVETSSLLLPSWLRILPLLPAPGQETNYYLFAVVVIILFLSILLIVVRGHHPRYTQKPPQRS